MRGDRKTARLIMLKDLEKEQEYEETEGGKRKMADSETDGSRHTLNIVLKKFGGDL